MSKKILISCSRPGIRRNGITHPATRTYDEGDWTDEQMKAFEADPAFTVTYLNPGQELIEASDTLARKHSEELARLRSEHDNVIDGLGKQIEEKSAELAKSIGQVSDLETRLKTQAEQLAAAEQRADELEKQLAAKTSSKK